MRKGRVSGDGMDVFSPGWTGGFDLMAEDFERAIAHGVSSAVKQTNALPSYFDAEDLVQDFVLGLLQRRLHMTLPGDRAEALSYLRRCAFNFARSRLSREVHRQTLLRRNFAPGEPDRQAPLPGLRRLECFPACPRGEAQVLKLLIAGRSFDQIARDLRVSKWAVYKRFERLKAHALRAPRLSPGSLPSVQSRPSHKP